MTARLIKALVFTSLLLSCKGRTANDKGTLVRDSAIQSNIKSSNINDSVLIINGSKFTLLSSINCSQLSTDTEKEVADFLNSNIQYFKTDTLTEGLLRTEMYYRSILKLTHFLEFEESSFNKENFTFSVTQSLIKDYGMCYVAKYYFAAALNAAQRRAIVIINLAKKEISIWNFEDVNITKDGLVCDFNTRGKHTFYKLNYSIGCRRFVTR